MSKMDPLMTWAFKNIGTRIRMLIALIQNAGNIKAKIVIVISVQKVGIHVLVLGALIGSLQKEYQSLPKLTWKPQWL